MGVDTGKNLHVVILWGDDDGDSKKEHLIFLATCRDFSELDILMEQFHIRLCVIDGLPETHATRDFARRHPRRVFLCFFNESQRGRPKWDSGSLTVHVNRTEALDASRAAVREKTLVLPRRQPIVEEFAQHMASDAKILDENEETGEQRYRYIRTAADHFSLALTYAWLATPVRPAGAPTVELRITTITLPD